LRPGSLGHEPHEPASTNDDFSVQREVNGAKGSIKFWVKDGLLSKYEYQVHGTFSFNGTDREINRTHTTEIREVGTTKVSVPDEAVKKL